MAARIEAQALQTSNVGIIGLSCEPDASLVDISRQIDTVPIPHVFKEERQARKKGKEASKKMNTRQFDLNQVQQQAEIQ